MAVTARQIDRAIELAQRFGATRLLLFGTALENPAEARDLDLACDGVLEVEVLHDRLRSRLAAYVRGLETH